MFIVHPNARRNKQHGFTLIELLIALSLFAVLSAMAFGGLNHLLKQHQELQKKQHRFANIQTALLVLERDLTQLVPRSNRDTYGDNQSAVIGGSTPEFIYQLTNKVWFNPHNAQGSLIQRVSYQHKGQLLLRNANAGINESYPLLDKVTGFSLKFLPHQGTWITHWPPTHLTGADKLHQLPKAIHLYLTTPDHGVIHRLFEVPARYILGSDIGSNAGTGS